MVQVSKALLVNFNWQTAQKVHEAACESKLDFLGIPSAKQQFGDMDVPESPYQAGMACHGRLRPASRLVSEYLENPFGGTRHERTFVQFAISTYGKGLLTPEPYYIKK